MQMRSAASKKPMIVVIGNDAREKMLNWYPVGINKTSITHSAREIQLGEDQATLWDLTAVKKNKTITDRVIADASIVIYAESILADKDKSLLLEFKDKGKCLLPLTQEMNKQDLIAEIQAFYANNALYCYQKIIDDMESFMSLLSHQPLVVEGDNVQLGNACYKNKKYEQAREYYLKAVLDNYNDVHAYHGLALCYKALNNNEQALIYINAALGLEKMAHGYAYRGYIYYLSRQLALAKQDIESAISLAPHVLLYHFLGNIFHESGNYNEAIECFNQILHLYDNDYRAYYVRGLTYEALNQYENAIYDYVQAIEKGFFTSNIKNLLFLLLNKNIITKNVCADAIFKAIEVFEEDKRIDLFISCFGPNSGYRHDGQELNLRDGLGKKLSEKLKLICANQNVDYEETMKKLFGDRYIPIKKYNRGEEKNTLAAFSLFGGLFNLLNGSSTGSVNLPADNVTPGRSSLSYDCGSDGES